MKNKIFYLLLSACMLTTNFTLLAQNQNITIKSKVNDDKTIDLLYEKKNPGTYTVNLEFSNIKNCNITSYGGVINENSGTLMKLKPIVKSRDIDYSMRYYSIMGEMNTKVDSLYPYLLPFKKGKKINIYEAPKIEENYMGQEVLRWKSYIAETQTPDTICNMRKGIVVEIKNEHEESSATNVHNISKRNQVIVEHNDGSFAAYNGFKKDGIFVQLGQMVDPQTELGILELYDNKDYRIDFNVYYLYENNYKEGKQFLNKYHGKYKFIMPLFATTEGNITIESGKEYMTFVK